MALQGAQLAPAPFPLVRPDGGTMPRLPGGRHFAGTGRRAAGIAIPHRKDRHQDREQQRHGQAVKGFVLDHPVTLHSMTELGRARSRGETASIPERRRGSAAALRKARLARGGGRRMPPEWTHHPRPLVRRGANGRRAGDREWRCGMRSLPLAPAPAILAFGVAGLGRCAAMIAAPGALARPRPEKLSGGDRSNGKQQQQERKCLRQCAGPWHLHGWRSIATSWRRFIAKIPGGGSWQGAGSAMCCFALCPPPGGSKRGPSSGSSAVW